MINDFDDFADDSSQQFSDEWFTDVPLREPEPEPEPTRGPGSSAYFQRKQGRPSSRQTEPFIKGPIPLAWIAASVPLRKPALAAGLALFFLRGVKGKNGPFRIDRSLRRRFNLTNSQMLRGLRSLEAAGLIRFTTTGRGHCPVVEILGV